MSKTVIASAEDLAIGLSCPSLRRCSAPLAHRNVLRAGPRKATDVGAYENIKRDKERRISLSVDTLRRFVA